jgi:hypothetical protein
MVAISKNRTARRKAPEAPPHLQAVHVPKKAQMYFQKKRKSRILKETPVSAKVFSRLPRYARDLLRRIPYARSLSQTRLQHLITVLRQN